MNSKTIITGGAGFIGSHLTERLKAEGRHLILIDNLSTGRRSNVEYLLDDRCQLIVQDVADAFQDLSIMDGVCEVYHLAASVGVKRVVDDPTGMIQTNIHDTTLVLEAAAATDAAVLVTSSSEVYGKCPVLPLREDMELVYGPTTASRWAYGMSKAIDEHLAIDLHRSKNLKSVIVRLFNTIGPRQVGMYGMVVPNFVQRAVRKQTINVFGDGSQTRAFCDVRDITRAMTELMATKSCYGKVYNLGSTHEITINDLADLTNQIASSDQGKTHIPYEDIYGKNFEDPMHRLPDNSKVKAAINFNPKYTLTQTITELVKLEQQALESELVDAKDNC
ncbi:UDP-glucose 4-epimerase [Poriferisphaera corsica]|uniref:UDP-glucuronate decarboxylase n=1 Tax=Poriferisphaera corsica TaxID=2528020 RepID=A0A517YXK6_9BACT|nr:GDP-mannose 4,6-dehydratase [Poriferisphaera corsica]QDU34955.1 UDP-glucose 4-epimerase [Poriferisphaera corsica]